jgi:transcriptional regulator with GAF, ATPase, and Fis domain
MTRDQLFREVTLRLCSSLDLETALRRAFPILARQFPIDDAYVDVLDADLGAIRRIAHVNGAEVLGTAPKNGPAAAAPPLIALPERLFRWVGALRGPILLRELEGPDARAFRQLVNLQRDSDLALALRIESRNVGFLILRAAGEGRYTRAHADLLAELTEPLAIALSNTLAHRELIKLRDDLLDDKRFLTRELFHAAAADDVIGADTGLRDVMEMVRQAAPLNSTVLFLGETGVGKDVVANVLHQASRRREAPFIKVNCGAIPDGLVDSELFGHEEGAFTGAHRERRGRFERADGGTLFLDEVGDLPLPAQVRLLRVLQNREIERVGGARTIPVDVRVIAATHRDLSAMVADGRFREDLWFRLNVFPISIPPLRLRREDVPALVRHFVDVKRRSLGLPAAPPIAPGALVRLQAYDWPGNVRELENLVERELIRSRRGELLRFDAVGPADRPAALRVEVPGPAPLRLDQAMAAHIERVLAMTRGKIHGRGGAAELLGVHENTLRNRMDRLGIVYGRRAREPERLRDPEG